MFCKYINQTRQNLLKNQGICDKVVDVVKGGVNAVSMGLVKFETNQLSMFDTLVLQSLEERWAMFLRRVDDEKLTNDQALEEYAKFEQKIEGQFRAGTQQVIINGANPFPFIQLGNHEFLRKNTEKASGYFESALKMDPDFAVGALVGIASVLLKDSKANNFKERAIRQFKDSLMILNKDMAFITVMQTLVQKQFPDGEGVNTPLFQQLMEKANLIGYFINTIQANIDGVERSLRRVHFGGVKKSSSNQRQELLSIPNEILQAPASSRTLPSNYKEYEGCRLTFHDLTHRNDSGVRDQAVNSLPNIKTSKIGLRCKSADIKKLIQDSETDLIKEGIPIMTLQLNCLEFDKESGNIIFNFDLLKVKIDYYDLEILVGDSEKLKEIGLKLYDHFKNSGQLKTIEVTMSNADNSHSCVSIVETLNASKVANISSHLTSIKILNLLSPTEVNAVAQIAGTLTSFGVPLSFNLTFNSIQQDKSLIIQSWDAVLSHYNNSVFHLCGMSSKQAKKIIPLMRKYNVGFLLDICDLDFTSAVKLLQNASIEQELMEESKMQKLTELFMPDRIPLREIMEMNARGLYLLISFNEKQFVPWISVLSVCGLAAVQVAVGGLLITTGFGASLGMSLITEGMSDFTTAYRAYSSRQFNWSDYRTQKAVSLVISATTLGLSGLKDGGKGLSILGSQFSGGAASNAAVSYTGKNLQSLAIKFVAVRGTETVARIGLKSLADNLSSFCFEQIRETIQVEVSSRVEAAFASQEFYESLSRAMAVENIMQPNAGKGPNGPSRLKKKIDGWVIATTNPKASGWTSWWDSVGSPLANGILADPNFVGSSWNTAVLCVGALSGIAQIGTVISKVCNDIQSKLNEERERDYLALLTSKGVLEETLRTITTKIKTSSSGYNKPELSTWSDSSVFSNKDEFKTFQSVFQKLKEQQSQIKKKSLERSMIEKGVVDLITSHIIKTANSHLVSPVLSKFAGQIVNSISEELQARFIVNDAQDSKEYPSQSRTLKGQIEANAKEHMITHQKQEMEKICNEAIERNQENPNSENQVSQEKVLDMAKGILTDAPLSSVMLSMAAKQNGIDIKIVTDPNYQATPEEKAAGIRIIVYESPPPGSPPNTIGHYLLKNENCDGFENVDRGAPNDKNNCGYNIIATLANKETDEVRSELGKSVLDNPEQFDKFLETEEWIHSRYPQEANTILGVGGRSSTPIEDIKRYLWPVEENKIIQKSEDEKISLDNGIDPNDENLNKERPVYTKYTVTKDDLGQGQPTSADKELAKDTRDKGISGDHACHVRSNREGGPMIPENLYPGNPSANNSRVKQIENARVKWINNGPEGANVEVEQRLIYSDDPNRPDKVYILNKYMVGDQPATSEQLRNIRVENTELFMVPNLPPNVKMAPTQRSLPPKTVNKILDNLESSR